MPSPLAAFLRTTIERELPLLLKISDEASAVQPNGPDSWSPRQELGHLIDSAANNHVRFVRAALEPEFTGPPYAQNDWVNIHGYQNMPWNVLVLFWSQYNKFLVSLLENIPEDKLSTICKIGSSEPATLRFVI